MAFSNRNPHQEEPIADINITPFVDVVLVLLIIFMITAGVVEFGLDIDVPKTREVATTSQDLDFINITAQRSVVLERRPDHHCRHRAPCQREARPCGERLLACPSDHAVGTRR